MDLWDRVKLVDLKVMEDDRGWLFEIVHETDEFFEKFGQVYMVGDMQSMTVRAFHRHRILWDYFCIVNGSAKFILIDNIPGAELVAKSGDPDINMDRVKIFNIHARTPKLLVVPPTIWHGWMSLEQNTILCSTGSEIYNKKNPDEERISWDVLGKDVWDIQFK